MTKKALKRTEYKRFIEKHILRPYQGLISASNRPLKFTDKFYNSIPGLVAKNHKWTRLIFSKLAETYKSLDADYFPAGVVQVCILNRLQAHGVIIDWGKRGKLWHELALTPRKGDKMPMTEEQFQKVLAMDAELILEQKDEISRLKMKVNKLQQKLNRKVKL